ncbi:MAG: YcxB family protein [Anaerolineae bacterium]
MATEITFSLEEADLVALARHQIERSPSLQKRYRLQKYGLVFGFLALAVVSGAVWGKVSLALYFAGLALFFFAFYPLYYRWLTNRTLRQIVSARLNPRAFAQRSLRITPEGLIQAVEGFAVTMGWDRLGPVTVTPDHAFLAVDGVYALVVPRAQLGEEEFNAFIQALQRHMP